MLNKLKKLDWIILLILAGFTVVSYILIHSATVNTVIYAGLEKKQLLYFIAGFVLILFLNFIDYRILLKSWLVSYLIGVAVLILIFPFGAEINGAKGWFLFFNGQLSVQPAEIVKILLILGIAHLMGKRNGEKLGFTKDIIPIAIFSLVPFILVMAQPDLGNAIIYAVIVIGMLWIGNVKFSFVLIGIAALAICVGMILFLFDTFNDEIRQYLVDKKKFHWYERTNTFLHPEQATPDARHQVENAMQAIGSGGLSGDGYLNGSMKNGGFIPYPYSDSIFVVVGEEFGFQGAAVVLLLYFMLIYRMIIIAFNCMDRKGSYIIIGVVSMFVFQVFQNIGMMIGITPITGITLPFISYGGTSLLINMLCIGVVFSVKAHQYKYELPD